MKPRIDTCPHCGSKSGVDTKNRGFCHACKKDFKDRTKSIHKKEDIEKCVEVLQFIKLIPEAWPEHFNKYLKSSALEYNLELYYNSKNNRFCVKYESKDSFAYWMRAIDGRQPKWLFYGDKTLVWEYNVQNRYDTVCLVEDVISALKVSLILPVICLGGTHLSARIKKSLQKYQKVILFLDGDSAGVAAKSKIRKQLKLNHPIKIIKNKKDPKEYSLHELTRLIL